MYIFEGDPGAALRFIDAVDRAIALLASNPEMGPGWRYADPTRPTRFLLVPGFRNYILFYRYEERIVRLGRLLHGAQDLADVLEEQ